MFESFINWDVPVTLCEGVFDAIAIKRNAIPILGKNISPVLLGKLLNHTTQIYIALDKDASKQAFKYAKQFMDEGKKVYFVRLPEKDPSDMGFTQYTNLVQNLNHLTFSDLLEQKLSFI
jgi:DNA primase